MCKCVLVPLDGSDLAEAALPVAVSLAETLTAVVMVVHVIERDAPAQVHGRRHITTPEEAASYLEEVAGRAFPAGLRVERHVHTDAVGDVAGSIVEHSGELQPDLIVMSTHGQGGLHQWLWGNIAQQVIARGTTPVLLVSPRAAGVVPFVCRQILVPLDGTPAHEGGLPFAAGLAQAYGATLHLAMVVPTLGTLSGERAAAGRLLPGTTAALLDLDQQHAAAYLQRLAAPLQASGLAVATAVARGDPAGTIVRLTRRVHADLIVLATHGRAGSDAFWSGSVAPRVSDRSHRPLLLVPLREKLPVDNAAPI